MGNNKWTGKNLSEDLARTLQSEQWMTWVNIPLGSVQTHNVQIADVLAVNKSFAHPLVKIYEIKVDRGDFQADVAREKYRGYFEAANQVYFAVPQGLLKVAELPGDGVGLIVRGDTTWHVVKAGKRTDFKLDIEMLLKLLMRGYEDHWQQYRSKERRKQEIKTYTTLRQAFNDYGVKVAQDIAQAQEIKQLSEEFLKKISKLMGKDYASTYDAVQVLRNDVQQLMSQKKHFRLALRVTELAIKLFDGELFWGDPVRDLERILDQAKKEFPNVRK